MNFFEELLFNLQGTMTEPNPFGWFHLMWIGFIVVALIVLFKLKNKYSEKQLKIVLGTYGIIALILEILKQLIWSFNYEAGIVTWDYQWYAAPFQLCSTPIYVSVICLFLKDSKIRESLLSYMTYITILGGFMTVLIPGSCLVDDILANIHTMWLHYGSFVVSVYLLMSGAIKINKKNLINSFIVFVVFVSIAQILNILVYNSGILNGETFNMFYVSPYFETDLPIYDVVQQNVPFIVYYLLYIISIILGGTIVYCISCLIKKLGEKYEKIH